MSFMQISAFIYCFSNVAFVWLPSNPLVIDLEQIYTFNSELTRLSLSACSLLGVWLLKGAEVLLRHSVNRHNARCSVSLRKQQ